MCRSMVDIQSAAAEIRRGKKEEDRNYRMKIYMVSLLHRATINKDRLMHLKLPTLKYRRLRGDMIEVFKIMHNLYDPEIVLARYGPKGKRYDTIDITQNIAIRYDTMHKRNVKFNTLQHGRQFVNVCCCCSGCERGQYSRMIIAAKQLTRARAQTISNLVG